MAKDVMVAPKERINIRYASDKDGIKEDVELPLKLLSIGDYANREDPRPMEERKPVNINKDNFNEVLSGQDVHIACDVKNTLVENAGEQLSINLSVDSMKVFSPDRIAQQVPELARLLELREALVALKGPLGNLPAFRKMIEKILGDSGEREKILSELGLGKDADKGGQAVSLTSMTTNAPESKASSDCDEVPEKVSSPIDVS